MSEASCRFVKSLIRHQAEEHEENYEIYQSVNELLDKSSEGYSEERYHILCDKPSYE
jgi:hypothetical protein